MERAIVLMVHALATAVIVVNGVMYSRAAVIAVEMLLTRGGRHRALPGIAERTVAFSIMDIHHVVNMLLKCAPSTNHFGENLVTLAVDCMQYLRWLIRTIKSDS